MSIHQARLGVYWNVAVMRDKRPLLAARDWIHAALRAGVTPMISFTGNGNYIPSWRMYAAAIKAFLHHFPQVRTYTPWNEPDWVYRPALANHPKLAADYFNVLIRWCHRCTIAARDVYLSSRKLGPWIRAYRRYLHAPPKAWALHNYYDVRTHTTAQLRTMERLTSGQIWLTEIGGVERRGHWQFRNQGVFAAARDEGIPVLAAPAVPTRDPDLPLPVARRDRHAEDRLGLRPDRAARGVPRPAYWAVAKAAGPRHTAHHPRAP